MGFLLSLVLLVGTVLALVDVVRQEEKVIKNLPKIMWVLLIVFIPIIGVTLWFLLGHDWKRGDGGTFVPGAVRRPRWGRKAATPTIVVRPAPKTTEEQLADLEREEAYYTRMAEEQRRRREGERPQDA